MHSRKITRNYLNDKNVLTAQQLKEIKDFYGPYVKNVGTLHHAFYTEKTGVFDKLGPGLSHSAVGHYELNVNESILCIKVSLNRSTRNTGYVLIN